MTPEGPVDRPYADERAQVLAAAHRCRAQGLQSGNGGNISLRLPGTALMAVKATEASFADTDPDAVVVVDLAGGLVHGDRKPTKECLLHGEIYARMPDVGAVVHCHSPWATGWASTGRPVPQATYHAGLKLGGPVPVVDTGGYRVPAEHVDRVLAAFAGPPAVRAVVLAGHGPVALGRDLADALCTAELVEETAQVAVVAALLGRGVAGPV